MKELPPALPQPAPLLPPPVPELEWFSQAGEYVRPSGWLPYADTLMQGPTCAGTTCILVSVL